RADPARLPRSPRCPRSGSPDRRYTARVTPPTSDDDLLLREDWNHDRNGRVYTLKVWTPRRDPTFASTAFVVWRQIVLYDDVPRPHVQLSPALALHDAIHFA